MMEDRKLMGFAQRWAERIVCVGRGGVDEDGSARDQIDTLTTQTSFPSSKWSTRPKVKNKGTFPVTGRATSRCEADPVSGSSLSLLGFSSYVVSIFPGSAVIFGPIVSPFCAFPHGQVHLRIGELKHSQAKKRGASTGRHLAILFFSLFRALLPSLLHIQRIAFSGPN